VPEPYLEPMCLRCGEIYTPTQGDCPRCGSAGVSCEGILNVPSDIANDDVDDEPMDYTPIGLELKAENERLREALRWVESRADEARCHGSFGPALVEIWRYATAVLASPEPTEGER
jgi:hypothetical protein